MWRRVGKNPVPEEKTLLIPQAALPREKKYPSPSRFPKIAGWISSSMSSLASMLPERGLLPSSSSSTVRYQRLQSVAAQVPNFYSTLPMSREAGDGEANSEANSQASGEAIEASEVAGEASEAIYQLDSLLI